MALRTGRARSIASRRLRGTAQPSQEPSILRDYVFGSPPSSTQIPYSWLAPPVRFRAEPLVNVATVNRVDGATAISTNIASRDAYGVRVATGSLDTACNADPANLALWLTTYRGDPRMRQPALTLVDLIQRTPEECVRILRVREGDRIVITDAPATWPQGASSLVVEGVLHSSHVGDRKVGWVTSAVPGTTAGTPGPWVRWGSSVYQSTDVIPF
jgi:hypothetical protein